MPLEDDEQNDDDEDDEDYALQELEMAAARAWHLERTVVPEQDRIIDQATQALNICDVYRQRSGLRSEFSSKFSPEHVHAERLLLIAGENKSYHLFYFKYFLNIMSSDLQKIFWLILKNVLHLKLFK